MPHKHRRPPRILTHEQTRSFDAGSAEEVDHDPGRWSFEPGALNDELPDTLSRAEMRRLKTVVT